MREKNLRLVCPAVSVPPMTHGMSARVVALTACCFGLCPPTELLGSWLLLLFFPPRCEGTPSQSHAKLACSMQSRHPWPITC